MDAAAQQIRAGDLRGAAATVARALDTDPGDPLLQNMGAALLLATGDTHAAETRWTAALTDMPGDSLALYGMGLVRLSRGNRSRAVDLFQVAERGGDRACCLIAERYAEGLTGAVGGSSGLAVPDSYVASASGLAAMAAYRAGDRKRALDEFAAALAALPGDPTAEPPGLVMTFEPDRPLRAGASLPSGNGLAAGRHAEPKQKALGGVVMLGPDGVDSYTGFVTFKVDGGSASIVNTPPFQFAWNTALVPNGVHQVEMTVYDRQGRETASATRGVRTANRNAPGRPAGDAARVEQAYAALWQLLLLRPSRFALAQAAGEAAKASGDQQRAAEYFEEAAAVAPDNNETHARLMQLTGDAANIALWRGSPGDRVVALTFDDGPKPGITDLLVKTLKLEGVPATFFVIGRHATEYPELIRNIAAAGMQIENHTYTHPNLTMLSEASIERELLRTIATVEQTTGRRMRYFRPPGGNMNGLVSRVAARWGLTPCMWTVDGEALESGTGDALVAFVLKHAEPGAIILLHNGRLTTVEALPRIVAGLRQRGYGFVTIDQLAARKGPARGAVVAPVAVATPARAGTRAVRR